MTAPAKKEPVALSSADPTAERIAALRALFPDTIADGKIDFDKLRSALGDAVAAGPERFTFSWAGRADTSALLQTPSRATLIPKPDQSVNWDTTKNLFIEGDNLEVLKLLYKAYAGKVKLIYIDPPYNTGQDFVYQDDFTDPLAVYLKLTGQTDEAGKLLTSNPEMSGRYHSAWLSMMYPRLFLARQLLRDDGVIFVSIDDHEVHHLRLLMNEVFGEENFIESCIWQKRYSRENREQIGDAHDYICVYARDQELAREAIGKLPLGEKQLSVYKNSNNDPKGLWRGVSFAAQGHRPNQMYEIVSPITGKLHRPPAGSCWKVIEPEYKRLLSEGRMYFGKDGNAVPQRIQYLNDIEGIVPWTWWPHEECGHTDEAKREIQDLLGKEEVFQTPKPVRLLNRILQIATKPDDEDIVLDFFAGSATFAHAVLELNYEDDGNRRFIMVQLPEPTGNKIFHNIAEIGKKRIRRVIEKLRKETSNLTQTTPQDLGFKVFKPRVPGI